MFEKLTYEENMLLQLKLHSASWQIMLAHKDTYIHTWEMEISELTNDLSSVYRVEVGYR